MNNYRIDDEHLLEWVTGSGVDPEIVKLNVRSLIPPATYDFLLYSDQLKRRNDGRLNGNTLKAYQHLDDRGWGVNAIDPETGEDLLWGQLKPNNPKTTPDGKVRKYEAPPYEPTQAICPKVSHRIGLKVAKKAGILKKYRERIRYQWAETEGITYKEFLRQKDQLFWKWVKDNPEITIAVVEGTKKAGALLSQGIAAISIPGIWNGSPKDDKGNPVLLPQLQYFAQPGREIVIIFDQDCKLKTQASVIAARERLANCFRSACCKVLFLSWETEEKGIDDAIVANGSEWFTFVWAKRGIKPAPIKIAPLEHNLPKWSEEGLAIYFEELYKDRLIFSDTTNEWYLYAAENDGKWSEISIKQLEKRIILELRSLKEQFDKINSQIRLAVKSVKEINRTKQEKKEIIEQLVAQIPTYGEIKINFVEKLGKNLSRLLLVKEMATNSQQGLIPFRNGVLDLDTRELLPHSPQNYFTWSLPYDYNPLAQCNPIKQWLLEMMEGDESLVNLIRAYLHGIVTGRADWQKFLTLCGPGGSGKSTLTKLAIALVGFENVHVTDLDILEKDKFETSNLKDKRLVIINEATSYKGVKKLKALTGGDRLRFEQKYKQALASFYPDALVIITSNEPIKTGDYTSGLYRREIPLSMNRRIPDKEQKKLIDHDRQNNIIGEFAPHIPGLLNWVLEMDSEDAKQIIKDPYNYAPALLKSKLDNLMDTNSIAAWLNEKIIYDPQYKTQVGCKSPLGESKEEIWLYASYCAYCASAGINTISLTRFSYLVLDLCNNQLGLPIIKDRNNVKTYIEGLKIRDHLDEDRPPMIEGIYTLSSGESVKSCVQEVMAETPISVECGDCGDFSETSQKNQPSSVALLDQPLTSSKSQTKIENLENNPPHSPQCSPALVTEDNQPNTDSPQEEKKLTNWDEMILAIDSQMERLGWDVQKGQQYIFEKYGKKSRQVLRDDQLLEFLEDLKAQPKFKVGQTAIFRGTKVIIE
ncbi:phage/plasmid primase, P4 family, partial [Crocosphaera watsonii]